MSNTPTTAESKPKSEVQKFGRTGLEPGAYSLDLRSVGDVPLQVDGQPSTFVAAYCKLRDSKIKEINSIVEDTYVTEKGEIHLDGPIGEWPIRATLRELAELLRLGIEVWMWCQSDVSWLALDAPDVSGFALSS